MTAQKKRPVVLSVENVDKRFPRVHAVKELSLQIHEGECVALLGPNGAGKTTLLEMIEGLQTPDLGRIVVDGFTYDKDEKKIRALMG
ncbi:MAG: ATP-binding cassette domain-containing protein, partial [Spirochaetes bacterium]|nr:ATP-binding cassette domain-containing protein [Spirochaetota bacterium]